MTRNSSRSVLSAAGANLPSAVWDRLELILERFEQAWQRGEQPNLDSYLHEGGAQRQVLLIELVHEDLEFRLKAGMPMRVEAYLERYPEVRCNRAVVVDLIATEFAVRKQRKDGGTISEYLQRFPDLAKELSSRLQPASTVPRQPVAEAVGADTRAFYLQEAGHDPERGAPRKQTAGRATTKSSPPSVPGYEILAELGRGGMGVVYKAQQIQLGRTVALKMILVGGHAGPEELARFKTEAEAVARLQHPGIVQIHETGVHQGLPYFSLEFVEGGSLDRKLAGAPLLPNVAARLTALLAQAVQAAHEKGILHRDLKPANVFLMPTKDSGGVPIEDRSGKTARYLPKIGDFGLAKKIDPPQIDDPRASSPAALTASGAIMGTPAYMAPEQALGNIREMTAAVDTYALGAILYELLTGRPPFRAATALETLRQVATDEPVPPGRLNAGTPRDLETICLKCLQKEAAKRYGSAQQLADELERFLQGEPILARPAGRLERAVKWAKRRPAQAGLVGLGIALAGVALLLVLAMVAGGVSLLFIGRLQELADKLAAEKNSAESARDEAEQQRDLAGQEKQEADKQRGLALDAEAEAQRQNALAQKERIRANLLVYARQLDLAQRAWETDNSTRAWELLDGCQPMFRGWEYRHLRSFFTSRETTFSGHKSWVTGVAFSPDGKRLASASWDKTVKVWNTQTGQEVSFEGNTGAVLGVAFSPDGKQLAGAGWDNTVAVWDAEMGRMVHSFKGHASRVHSVCFSPDGKRLASGGADRMVRVWDLERGQEVLTLKGHAGLVYSVAFSSDGKRLASASEDRTVRIWDTEKGTEVFNLTGHLDHVTSVAFSPDSKRLASASYDQTVKLWDTDKGQVVRTLPVHLDMQTQTWDKGQAITLKGYANGVAFSPDGKRLAAASGRQAVKVWDTETGRELFTLTQHTDMVTSVAFSPDGKQLASGSYDQTVKLWDREKAHDVPTLRAHTSWVNSVAFSPDSKRLASASQDQTVKVWDADKGREILTLNGRNLPVRSVAFSRDGRRLAIADKTVTVWDSETGREVVTLNGHTDLVNAVAFSPDGKLLACAGSTTPSQWAHLTLWDPDKARVLHSLDGHKGAVFCIAFSPDGKRLASGSECGDQAIKLWNVESGRELLTIKMPSRAGDNVASVAFSPDGKRLATVTIGAITIRDADSGEVIQTFEGHRGAVRSLAFSSDGKRLASAADDQTIKIWDSATGQEVLTLTGHTGTVLTLAFSADGKRLASGSADGTVKLWVAD